MESSVVRVAVSNNFNCTPAEWAQLDAFKAKHPEKIFFVNSNIHTPALLSIVDHPYKAVVTVNPGIRVKGESEIQKSLLKLLKIKDRIAFVRVKYVPDDHSFVDLVGSLLALNIPVVVTLQRFNGLRTLQRFTDRKHYAYSCSRFRLTGSALKKIVTAVAGLRAHGQRVWICDQSGLGCGGCGLCSKLTTGKSLKISSLNLSSSGVCPYDCPDCYAKTMQHFCKSMGHNPIMYDKILRNKKQSGRTAHIQEVLKHATIRRCRPREASRSAHRGKRTCPCS